MSKYYAALALERLGRKEEGADRLSRLAEGPEAGRVGAHNYFVAGLAERHLGRELQAAKYLTQAVDINPSLWQAEGEFDQ
jgi:tetratricopeptide (TPR) repeat protein